jgi:nicotinamidase-related amidase
MPLVDHEDSVLIVIDAQQGFYGDRLPADESARAREALDRMVWLAGVAARLDIPAVITEEDPKRNGPTSPAIAERLGQASALIKPTFGLTGTPEIVKAVEETGRKTAVLVGFETDVCVAQSAIGLRERGMRVVVPDDAVYSPGEMHARGIARMTAEGVEINHCKGLAYEWTRTLDRSREILGADGPGDAPFRL